MKVKDLVFELNTLDPESDLTLEGRKIVGFSIATRSTIIIGGKGGFGSTNDIRFRKEV